jgi:hypothetical protein
VISEISDYKSGSFMLDMDEVKAYHDMEEPAFMKACAIAPDLSKAEAYIPAQKQMGKGRSADNSPYDRLLLWFQLNW